MALNSRTAPQKSFGRRPAPLVRAEPPPPASPQVEEMLEGAQPAANWLTEVTGQAPRLVIPPPPSPPHVEIQPTDQIPLDVTAASVVGRSLAVIAKNPITFLAVLAAIALPEQFLAYLPLSAGLPAQVVMPICTTLGCMALYAAAFGGALASLKGEAVNLDTCLRAVGRTSGAGYRNIAVMVSSLSLMLIVPAIGVAGRWMLAAPVAIVEGKDARVRSVALTAPYRGQIRLLVLLLAGLTVLRGLMAISFATSSMVSALTNDWLFPMLLTVFAAVAGAVLYRQLVPAQDVTPA